MVRVQNPSTISPLVEGWEETMIWSYLQGHMGEAWTDCAESPNSVQIIVGDLCFLAGIPNAELAEHIPVSFRSPALLVAPKEEAWYPVIEAAHNERYEKFLRYAFFKGNENFDKQKLQSFVDRLPSSYQIQEIKKDLYHKAKNESWSQDLCSQFPTYLDYKQKGLGYAVLHNETIVSGASSYTVYDDGIEIEIDTKEEYRRKGLAQACAAKLILSCLEKGLYPSWDAANKVSVHLAEKLGYRFSHEYVTYAVINHTK